MRRRFQVVLFAAGLVGCGDKISRPTAADSTAAAPPAPAPAVASARLAEVDMAQSVSLQRPSPAGRKVIRNTTLSLQVQDADVAIPLIDSIARKHDVVIGDAQVARKENKRQSARYVLHVPAPEFDATLDAVRALGEVQRESGAAEDVTKAYTDLETRIAVKESTVQRLQALLINRTAKLSDVLQVEQEVARAVTELEQMKGERRFYDTQVAMATITVDIAEPFMVGPTRVTPSVSIALRRSLDLLGESAARVAYFTAFMTPWVVLASLLLWGAWRLGLRWQTGTRRDILPAVSFSEER